jgi:hypothetical protein
MGERAPGKYSESHSGGKHAGSFDNAGTGRKAIGPLPMKLYQQRRSWRDGHTIFTDFEGKKEIPDNKSHGCGEGRSWSCA